MDSQHDSLEFPEGFLWGAAGAAHQIEGGNTNNDWWEFEHAPGSRLSLIHISRTMSQCARDPRDGSGRGASILLRSGGGNRRGARSSENVGMLSLIHI